MTNDKLIIGGHEFTSRFILGSGKYNLNLIEAAIKNAGAQIITLALRRANTDSNENILDYIPEGITLLPNTSGARNAEEAVRIARLAIDKELQGKGIGKWLLAQAFIKIVQVADVTGIYFIVVDAKETSKAFYEHYGFIKFNDEELTYFILVDTVRKAIQG